MADLSKDRLVIEKGFLEDILSELYDLAGLTEHFAGYSCSGGVDHANLLKRISKVELLLKNAESYEVICHKCGIRENGNKPVADF